VLVHGAWADGSSWSRVALALQSRDLVKLRTSDQLLQSRSEVKPSARVQPSRGDSSAVADLNGALQGGDVEAARAALCSLVGNIPVFQTGRHLAARLTMSPAALIRNPGNVLLVGSGGVLPSNNTIIVVFAGPLRRTPEPPRPVPKYCANGHALVQLVSRLGSLSSRQAEVLQRSASDPASDIGFDDQFEYINVVKVDLILFNFAHRFGWTEIPLLANNLFKCAAAIRRPTQNELLCTPNFVFLKNKGYAFEPLRVIEDQTDRLVPRRCRPPAARISGTKGRLDRKVLVFRRDLDHGCTLEV